MNRITRLVVEVHHDDQQVPVAAVVDVLGKAASTAETLMTFSTACTGAEVHGYFELVENAVQLAHSPVSVERLETITRVTP